MGLNLNHISASSGGLVDGESRRAIGVSGSMFFNPGGAVTGASFRSAAPDSAYIFSGTVGGEDKAVFFGDVTVSGTLKTGGGGSFVNTDGTGATNYVTSWVDGDTVRGSANLQFDNTDLSLAGTGKMTYRASTQYIQSPAANQLLVVSPAFQNYNSAGAKYISSGSLLISGSAIVLRTDNPAKTAQVSLSGSGGVVLGGKVTLSGGSGIVHDLNGQDFDIDASGDFLVDAAGAVSIDSTSSTVNLTAGGGVATVAGSAGVTVTSTGGTLTLNGTGQIVDLNSAALDIDASGAVNIAAAGAASDIEISSAHTAGVALYLSGAAAAGSIIDIDAGILDIDAVGAVTIDAGSTVSIDGGGALNIDTTSGGISVGTSTSGIAVSIGHSTSEVTVNDNLTVTGDLTVNGTTTTIDTTNLNVQDPFALFGDGAQSANSNAGIVFVSGSSAGATRPDVVFGRKSNDVWGLGSIASNSGSITSATAMTHDIRLMAKGFVGSLTGSVLSGLTNNRIVIAGAGGLLGDDADLTFDGTTLVAASALTVGASNAGAVALNGTTIEIDGSSTFSIDGVGASNVTTNGALTVSGSTGLSLLSHGGGVTATGGAASSFTTSAGALTLTSAAAATWSTAAGALVIDGAGGLTLDSDGAGNDVNLGIEAVAKTITIGNAASTMVDINALALDFDSAAATNITSVGGMTLSAGAASNFGTTSGPLTIGSAAACTWGTAGNLTLSSSDDDIILDAEEDVVLDAGNGQVYFDLATTRGLTIDLTNKVVKPESDNLWDLGGASNRFRNIYTGDLNLQNDRGNWTLIEESGYISFRNNDSGKRYKMLMEEVTGDGTYGPGNDGVL